MKKIIFFLAFFIWFAQIVFAADIFTSDSAGNYKNSFYPNDTVYLAPTAINITSSSATVRVYIVVDSNSWLNATALTDVSGGYKNFTTNFSGFLASTNMIWPSTLNVGNYDVVIDTDQDGIYSQGIDFIFDPSATGFRVVPIAGPTLAVAAGENNTADHLYTIPSNITANLMMQVKMSAGGYENVKVNSLILIDTATGDVTQGISSVRLYLDANNNGVYDSADTILSGAKFLKQNGVAGLDIPDGYVIPANSTSYFLIVYDMTNKSSNGNTYSFQLASVSAVGATSGASAKVSGPLPMSSAITTISAVGATTTTTSAIIPTTTATLTTTTTTSQSQNFNFSKYFWIYVAGAVSITAIIIFTVLYLRATRTIQYEYKPPAQKE